MTELPTGIDGGAEKRAAGYKSWKKKYRKMRIVFDQKMHECEELHKQEAKAAATVKRLAIENDRLLDLLLEVNNSPQIPLQRRIDLALKPPADSKALCLPIDREFAMRKDSAMKKLDQMMRDVPHPTYTSAKESDSSFLADLAIPEGENFPASFLSADDVDDYIYLIDTSIDPEFHAPTLAPLARPSSHPPPPPQLKNPTSVTNWLRKHAPKIFLQDGEAHDGEEAPEGTGPAAAAAASSSAATGPSAGSGHASARKPRGGSSKADRSSTTTTTNTKASAKSKRASTAARASLATTDRGDWDASLDDDLDFGATPVARGKRKRDEDQGYKPRGSSSRPSKKKRKNDVEATPTIRKSSKKEAAAANKND